MFQNLFEQVVLITIHYYVVIRQMFDLFYNYKKTIRI